MSYFEVLRQGSEFHRGEPPAAKAESESCEGWQVARMACCNAFALLSPGGSENPA